MERNHHEGMISDSPNLSGRIACLSGVNLAVGVKPWKRAEIKERRVMNDVCAEYKEWARDRLSVT